MAVHNQTMQIEIGPTAQVAAGTGVTFYWLNRLPGRWYIDEAYLVPQEAQAANVTNNAVYTLAKNGTSVASRSYASGDSVAGTAEVLTLTAAQREITTGDVLSWAKTNGGTGLAGTNKVVCLLRRIQ